MKQKRPRIKEGSNTIHLVRWRHEEEEQERVSDGGNLSAISATFGTVADT